MARVEREPNDAERLPVVTEADEEEADSDGANAAAEGVAAVGMARGTVE